ncbi:hypothetical protein HK102_000277, partial [Quaeritorhiza haematococci]
KDQSALDGGSFLQSLQPVGTLVISYGEEWIVKDETWDDLRANIVFPDGTSEAPLRPMREEDVTVKIGFMWSAKPSYTEVVTFNGSDVNNQLQAIQAYVDYWNAYLMPPKVKLELVYGAHGFDVWLSGFDVTSDGETAISETGRLINKEKISFFIGDMTDALTIAEAPLLADARLLHCATSDPTVFRSRGSLDLGYNVISMVASPGQYGAAARSLLAAWPAEGRVVVSYERDVGGECLQRLAGFDDEWVDPPVGKPLGTWSTRRIPNDESYRDWEDWARQIQQIRAYNASVIVHCGSARHFYSLVQEAVNQGMMEKKKTVFVLLKTPEVDLEEAGFPTTLAQHMFGTLVLDETNLRSIAESEDDPYFRHVQDYFHWLNAPFQTADGQRPTLTLETAETASCLAILLPSLLDLGNSGFDVTWEEIAEGRLFQLLDRDLLRSWVNWFGTPGRGDVLRTLTKTGHEARPMSMSNELESLGKDCRWRRKYLGRKRFELAGLHQQDYISGRDFKPTDSCVDKRERDAEFR